MRFGLLLLFPHQWNVQKYIQKETEALMSKELARTKPARKTRASRSRGGRNNLEVMPSASKSRAGLPELGKLF